MDRMRRWSNLCKSLLLFISFIVPFQPTIFSQRLEKKLTIFDTKANISIGTNIVSYDKVDLTINCDYRPLSPKAKITWISSSSSEKFKQADKSTNVLFLNDITPLENGVYTCEVKNEKNVGDKQFSSVNVIARSYPKIITRNDTIKYTRGDKLTCNIGDTIIVTEYANVFISCPHTSVPKAKVTWLRNGMKIEGDGDASTRTQDELYIKAIRLNYADKYTCVVTNDLGSTQASSHISVVPEYSKSPRIKQSKNRNIINILSFDVSSVVHIGDTVRVVKGVPLRIKCDAIAIPPAELTWEFNRKPIADKTIIQTSDELLFLNFQEKHSGDYKCVATNLLGQARRFSDIRVIVPTAPTILSGNRFLKIASQTDLIILKIGEGLKTSGGRDILIQCHTKGYPIARILWKLNDKMVTMANKNFVIDNSKQTLMISKADQWDSGTYSCFATNGAGAAVSSSKLNILAAGTPVITSIRKVQSAFGPEELVDIEIGTNLTTTVGKTLRIYCPSDGSQSMKSNYEWTINGEQLHYDTRINLNNGNELIIYDLQFFDNGIYSCRVYSQTGFDIMASKIQVLAAANTGASSINTNTGTTSSVVDDVTTVNNIDYMSVLTGQSAEIKCTTRGSIRPKIQWLKDDVPIEPSNNFMPRGEMLALNNIELSFAGRYTCVITTAVGTIKKVTNLKVKEFQLVQIKSRFSIMKAISPSKRLRATIGSTIYAIEGVTIKLVCPTVATPAANITWLFQNKLVYNNALFSHEKTSDALIIPKMATTYRGNYQCQATQGNKVVTAATRIFFLTAREPKISASSGEISTDPSYYLPVHVRIGDSLVSNLEKKVLIHCISSGIPSPRVYWKLNDTSIPSHFNDLKNGSIEIKKIGWKDQGKIECFAVNQAGMDSAVTNVKVVGKYIPLFYKPVQKNITVLEQSSKALSVAIGNNVTIPARNSLLINCPVSIYDRIKVKWEKDGKIFTGARSHSDGSVLMTNLRGKDAGEYKCFNDDHTKHIFGSVFLNVLVPSSELIEGPSSTSIDVDTDVFVDDNTVHKIGNNIKILQYGTFIFSCPVVKNGASPSIQWLKNNSIIGENNQNYGFDKTKLVVKDTEYETTYNISCRVSTLLGFTDLVSKVTVEEPQGVVITVSRGKLVSSSSKTLADIGGDIRILDGSSVDIQCKASSKPPPVITWKHNGRLIKDGGNKYFKNIGRVLSVPFATTDDNGMYECAASNGYGSPAVATSNLQTFIPQRPRIIITADRSLPGVLRGIIEASRRTTRLVKKNIKSFDMLVEEIGNDYKVLSGGELKLTCKVEGDPAPSIEWRKNNNIISSNENHVMIDTNKLQNSGEYECRATNPFGEVAEKSFIDIIVPSAPVIQLDPNEDNKTKVLVQVDGLSKIEVFIGNDLKTLDGTVVYIRCPVIGIPRPRIRYLKDDKPVTYSEHLKLDSIGSLIVTAATLERKSNGVYTCLAENEAGHVTMNTTLQLLAPTKPSFIISYAPPSYRYDLRHKKGTLKLNIGDDSTAYANTMIELRCPVVGFPFPLIMWEKDDIILHHGDRAYLKENTTVLHYKLNEQDGGVFTCSATNMAGSVSKKTVITIKDPMPPKILASKYQVTIAQNMSSTILIGIYAKVLEGSTLTITCPHLSEPLSKIVWRLEGAPELFLETNPDIEISPSGYQLVIKKVKRDLTGKFICQATNLFGSDESSSVVVASNAGAPRIRSSTKDTIANEDVDSVTGVIGGNIYVTLGMRVIIECPITGSPMPLVSWYLNGNRVESNSNVYISSSTYQLVIEYARSGNEGNYTCVAQNFLEKIKEQSYLLIGFKPSIREVDNRLSPLISTKVAEEIEIPVGIKEAHVLADTKVMFRCHAKGYPLPTCTWYYNDFPIDYENKNKYKSVESTMLELTSITVADQGKYKCVVSNLFGESETQTSLKVLVAPTIDSIQRNVSFVEYTDQVINAIVGHNLIIVKGMSISLSCPVNGRPVPTIKWSKRNGTLNLDPRMYLTMDQFFRINKARLDDSGDYMCTATNEAGSSRAYVNVLVADQPTAVIYSYIRKQEYGSSKALSTPDSKLVRPKGSHLQLYCHVTGSPTPTITWLKDHDIVRSNDVIQYQYDKLDIVNISEKHDGTYVCLAENILGRVTALLDVSVGAFPSINTSIANLKLVGSDKQTVLIGSHIRAEIGASISLLCSVNGSPTPAITWLKRANRNGNKYIRIQSSERGILKLPTFSKETSGEYTCVAKNVIGEVEATSVISFIEKPFISTKYPVSRRSDEKLILMNKQKDVHLIEGERFRFVCFGEGNPLPDVRYARKTQQISSTDLMSLLGIKKPPSNHDENYVSSNLGKSKDVKLRREFIQRKRIRFVREDGNRRKRVVVAHAQVAKALIDHSGLYSCDAENEAGMTSAEVKLSIYSKPVKPYEGVWISTEFSNCSTPCNRANFGVQKRVVKCLSYRGRIVRNKLCDPKLKPAEIKDCETKQCSTQWKGGYWSECSSSCGDQGIQTRQPYCLFSLTKKQTLNTNCAVDLIPVAKQSCNQFSCNPAECVDQYQHCKLIKKLKFCRIESYKSICCKSCVISSNFKYFL